MPFKRLHISKKSISKSTCAFNHKNHIGKSAETKLLHIDLFSGIGGFSLALSDICSTVSYCEINPTSNLVLQKNMDNGLISKASIQKDIRTFHYDKKVNLYG